MLETEDSSGRGEPRTPCLHLAKFRSPLSRSRRGREEGRAGGRRIASGEGWGGQSDGGRWQGCNRFVMSEKRAAAF
jgi:hypothetical protein